MGSFPRKFLSQRWGEGGREKASEEEADNSQGEEVTFALPQNYSEVLSSAISRLKLTMAGKEKLV